MVWLLEKSSNDQDDQDQESISTKHMICVIFCWGGGGGIVGGQRDADQSYGDGIVACWIC